MLLQNFTKTRVLPAIPCTPPPKQISRIADTDKEQLQKLNDDIPYSFFTCNKIHFHVIIILRFTQLNIYSTVFESKPYAIAQNQPEHAKRITDMSQNPKICLIM